MIQRLIDYPRWTMCTCLCEAVIAIETLWTVESNDLRRVLFPREVLLLLVRLSKVRALSLPRTRWVMYYVVAPTELQWVITLWYKTNNAVLPMDSKYRVHFFFCLLMGGKQREVRFIIYDIVGIVNAGNVGELLHRSRWVIKTSPIKRICETLIL